jgi:hypothetical protein
MSPATACLLTVAILFAVAVDGVQPMESSDADGLSMENDEGGTVRYDDHRFVIGFGRTDTDVRYTLELDSIHEVGAVHEDLGHCAKGVSQTYLSYDPFVTEHVDGAEILSSVATGSFIVPPVWHGDEPWIPGNETLRSRASLRRVPVPRDRVAQTMNGGWVDPCPSQQPTAIVSPAVTESLSAAGIDNVKFGAGAHFGNGGLVEFASRLSTTNVTLSVPYGDGTVEFDRRTFKMAMWMSQWPFEAAGNSLRMDFVVRADTEASGPATLSFFGSGSSGHVVGVGFGEKQIVLNFEDTIYNLETQQPMPVQLFASQVNGTDAVVIAIYVPFYCGSVYYDPTVNVGGNGPLSAADDTGTVTAVVVVVAVIMALVLLGGGVVVLILMINGGGGSASAATAAAAAAAAAPVVAAAQFPSRKWHIGTRGDGL